MYSSLTVLAPICIVILEICIYDYMEYIVVNCKRKITAKATKSVRDVIVIETPACFKVNPIRSGRDKVLCSMAKLL